jgi:hypothetical protein
MIQGMPSTPLPAATVILRQDGPVSPLVLMLERHAKSEVLRLSGYSIKQGADINPEAAQRFLVAAVRETFEESGIMLARRRGEPELLEQEAVIPLLRHRLNIQAGHKPFREIVEAEDLELATDILTLHARWVTPELVPHRFDTWFFAALAPAGQSARPDGVESSSHVWIRPEDALDERKRGERQILFPTACNLETFAGFQSARLALEASRRRPVVTVMPVLKECDGQRKLVIPHDAGYATAEELLGALPEKPWRKPMDRSTRK